MMSDHEATGRTVDEAVATALTFLGIRKENAQVAVLEEPSQGLLGIIGSKSARVMVRAKLEPAEFLRDYLTEVLELMNLDGRIEIEEGGELIKASIYGSDAGILIGRRGKTLGDLQYLLNIIMRRQFAFLNKIIVIDVENYRERRERTLTQLAQSVARRVIADNRDHVLEPMSPQERRIIHLALQDMEGVATSSTGEEPYRKVVITPK